MLGSGASSISKYTHADNSNPRDGSSYLRARRSICLPDVVSQKAKSRLLRDRHYPRSNVLRCNLAFPVQLRCWLLWISLTEKAHLARAPLPDFAFGS